MTTTKKISHPAVNQAISDQPAIYCGTYHKYNSGSIEGAWIDLTYIDDPAEFFELCAEIHSDESDPEFMFQDFQGFPRAYYSEAMGENDCAELLKVVKFENLTDSEKLGLWREYCDEDGYADLEIYDFDDDFFETFFSGKVTEAVRAAIFGNICWSHDYIYFKDRKSTRLNSSH